MSLIAPQRATRGESRWNSLDLFGCCRAPEAPPPESRHDLLDLIDGEDYVQANINDLGGLPLTRDYSLENSGLDSHQSFAYITNLASISRIVAIWDGENMPIGREASAGSFHATTLVESVIAGCGAAFGEKAVNSWTTAKDFWARNGSSKITLVLHQKPSNPYHFGNAEREAIIDAGVTIVDPGAKKGAVDVKVKELLSDAGKDEDSSKAIILLIGGDRDFAPEVRQLRERGFFVVLLHTGSARLPFRQLFAAEFSSWEAIRRYAGLGELPSRELSEPSSNYKLCWYFSNGTCLRGSSCRWIHQTPHSPQELKLDTFIPAPLFSSARSPKTLLVAAPPPPSEWGKPVEKYSLFDRFICLFTASFGVIVLLGLVWIVVDYLAALQLYGRLQDHHCQLIDKVVEPALSVSFKLPWTKQSWTSPSPIHIFPLTFMPATTCRVHLEALDESTELGSLSEFADKAGFVDLTFVHQDRSLGSGGFQSRCPDFMEDRIRAGGSFRCSFASNNNDGWGVFASEKSALSNLAMLALILMSRWSFCFNCWLYSVLCLLVGLAANVVRGCRVVSSRRAEAPSSSSRPTVPHTEVQSLPFTLREDLRQGSQGICCHRLWQCWLLTLTGAVIAGGVQLASQFGDTKEVYERLDDAQCRVAHDSKLRPAASWFPPWTAYPARSCWASLEIRSSCGGSLCWQPPEHQFLSSAGLALVTFGIDFHAFVPGYHQFGCLETLEQFREQDVAFNCSIPPDDFAHWGIMAASKGTLSNLLLLDMSRAPLINFPLLPWVLAVLYLSVVIFLHCVCALPRFLCQSCCCNRHVVDSTCPPSAPPPPHPHWNGAGSAGQGARGRSKERLLFANGFQKNNHAAAVRSGGSEGLAPRNGPRCRPGFKSVLVLLVAIVFAGCTWLIYNLFGTQQMYVALEDSSCRLTSPSAMVAPSLWEWPISLPFSNDAWKPNASDSRWTLLPAIACRVRLEVLSPCADGKCWQTFAAPLRGADGWSTLTFDNPRAIWHPNAHHLSCDTEAATHFAMAEGFACSFVPGDPLGFGVFATIKRRISSLLLLELTITASHGFPLWLWCGAFFLVAVYGFCRVTAYCCYRIFNSVAARSCSVLNAEAATGQLSCGYILLPGSPNELSVRQLAV